MADNGLGVADRREQVAQAFEAVWGIAAVHQGPGRVAELLHAQIDGARFEGAAGTERHLLRGKIEVVVQGADIDRAQRGAEFRQFRLEFGRELVQRYRQRRFLARPHERSAI